MRRNFTRAGLAAGLLAAAFATGAHAGLGVQAKATVPGLCEIGPTVSTLLGCSERHSANQPTPTSQAARAPNAATAPQLQPSPAIARASTQPTYVPNVVVVRFRAGVSIAQQRSLLHRMGATIRERIPQLHLDVASVGSVSRAQAKLEKSALVMHATRDEVLHVLGSVPSPDDSFYSYQWGFRQAGFGTVWQRANKSRPVLVAVIDTGVDATQPDLAGVVRPEINLVSGSSVTGDDNGHGTAVAGVIAALANNGVGGAGVCSACSILPIKAMGSNGNGDLATVAAAVVRATDMHARVIDLSLGGPQGLDALAQAVSYANSKGVIVVAAAGNSGLATPFFPANYPGVLSVAGSTQSDRLYSWSEHGTWIAVSAPGCNVAPLLHGGYGSFCGTSSATPLTAGLAGLMIAAHPNVSNARVLAAIEHTAKHIHAAVRFGRISASAALAAVH
jgi:subtilisin family serine protease